MAHGPYIQAALFMERLIEEEGGDFSLLHVRDTAVATRDADGDWTVETEVFVSVAGGDLTGPHTIWIRWSAPDGSRPLPEIPKKHVFEGGLSAILIHLQASLTVGSEGVYWCDVYINEGTAPLTRMPLKVEFPH